MIGGNGHDLKSCRLINTHGPERNDTERDWKRENKQTTIMEATGLTTNGLGYNGTEMDWIRGNKQSRSMKATGSSTLMNWDARP